jgi:hypothetical protein
VDSDATRQKWALVDLVGRSRTAHTLGRIRIILDKSICKGSANRYITEEIVESEACFDDAGAACSQAADWKD